LLSHSLRFKAGIESAKLFKLLEVKLYLVALWIQVLPHASPLLEIAALAANISAPVGVNFGTLLLL
jgi:hypothetical protein